jgi:hypothetical protein
MDAKSVDLKRVIGAAAGATTTLALRAGDLKQALVNAPFFENVTVKWFTKGGTVLTNFAKPAGALADAAPYIDQLLTQVKPFTAAAVPTLNRAAAVAPTLTQLADQATPTIKQAVPTLSALSNLALLAKPLSAWLGLSAQDLVAIPAGWSHAVQMRDGLSHLFGGEIYLDPQIVLGVANKGASAAQRRQNILDILNPAIVRTLGLLGAQKAAGGGGGTSTASAALHTPTKPTTPTSGPLGGLLGGLTGGGSGSASGPGSRSSSASGPASGNGSSSGSSGGGAVGPLGSSLQNLLGYLLGK